MFFPEFKIEKKCPLHKSENTDLNIPQKATESFPLGRMLLLQK